MHHFYRMKQRSNSQCHGQPPPSSAATVTVTLASASARLLPFTLSCSKCNHRSIVSSILLFTLLSLLSPSFFPSLSLPTPLAVSAALEEGSLYSANSWQYLAKFCFDDSGGIVRFSFLEDSLVTKGTQYVTFYADQDESWYSVKDDMSCQQKRGLGKARFPLSDLVLFNYSYMYPVGGIHPRWWFVAVSNCGGGPYGLDGPLSISYFKIHSTNRPGRFSYEFGKDIQGIPEMSIFFTCLYAILMCLCAWIKQHAKEKKLQYTIVKFLFASICVEFIALIFYLAHFAKYSYDGKGVPQLESAYYFFDVTSNLILLDLVLNISKGWTISNKYAPYTFVNLIIIAVLGLLYLAIYLWVQKVVDPSSTAYFYENEFGWCMVAVRLALLLWVAYCVYVTYNLESERSKRLFYHLWMWAAAVWMVSLPIIVLSVHALPAWRRPQVAFASMNSVQAAMFIFIMFLFRPFQSNRYVNILKDINTATVAPAPNPAAVQLNRPSPEQVEAAVAAAAAAAVTAAVAAAAAGAAAAAAANIKAEAEMAVPSVEQQQQGIPMLPIPAPIQPRQQDPNQVQTQEVIIDARPVPLQQQQQQQQQQQERQQQQQAQQQQSHPSLEQQQQEIPMFSIPAPIPPQQQAPNQAQTQEIIVARLVPPQLQHQQPLLQLDQPQQPVDIPVSSNVSDPVIESIPLEQNLPNQPVY